jgi:hypothetical protein
MLKGIPTFPVRCKVRLSPMTRKPTRVKTFMPKRMSLVSNEIYSSVGPNPKGVPARDPLLYPLNPSNMR